MASKTLDIFSQPFVAILRSQIAHNLDTYSAPSPWALTVEYSGQKSLPTRYSWEPSAINLIPPDDGARNNDAQNAIALHRHLNFLTAAQAADERLWCRLAHVEFWQYMRARWPAERFPDLERAERFVAARYFVPQSQGRALLRNGIARLWWSAHLTYDRHRDNPYELTDILLSRLDIAKNILERSLGRSRVVLIGFLDFLRQNGSRLLIGGERSRSEIRILSRLLNLLGGVNLLDALTEEQVVSLLNQELEHISLENRDGEDALVPAQGDEDVL